VSNIYRVNYTYSTPNPRDHRNKESIEDCRLIDVDVTNLSRCAPLEVLSAHLELQGACVLDVGCGDGWLARSFVGQVGQVTGIDPTLAQLELARLHGSFTNLHYVRGVGELLPVKDAGVDIVIYFNSLHHVATAAQEKALVEGARVLKDKGYVYIQEPVAAGSCYELCRPVEDEQFLYAYAYERIRSVSLGGLFFQTAEEWFLSDYTYADFETFCKEMLCVNSTRSEGLEQHKAVLREDFKRLGKQKADGWHFDQVQRVNVLRKPWR